jgi:molybdopterin-guanine dinucleotide biosynthesis protein A
VPLRDGDPEPLAATYPKRGHEIAFRFIAQSRHSVCDFAEACRREGAVRTLRVTRPDAACFANWNSPVDAAMHRRQLASHLRTSRHRLCASDTWP